MYPHCHLWTAVVAILCMSLVLSKHDIYVTWLLSLMHVTLCYRAVTHALPPWLAHVIYDAHAHEIFFTIRTCLCISSLVSDCKFQPEFFISRAILHIPLFLKIWQHSIPSRCAMIASPCVTMSWLVCCHNGSNMWLALCCYTLLLWLVYIIYEACYFWYILLI